MYTLLTSWMAADRVLGMGGGSRIVVAHGFRKIHSLRHGDGDRCRLEMPTSASWLGAQTPSYAFGHSIGHRDLLTDNTSTRWAELWRPQGRSLRWMDGRGIIARSRTPVDHLKCSGAAALHRREQKAESARAKQGGEKAELIDPSARALHRRENASECRTAPRSSTWPGMATSLCCVSS